MDERCQVLEQNLRLVGWFVRCRLPRWLKRLAGGPTLLEADLYPAYIRAVDKWLASDRRRKLSTFVCKALTWKALRLARHYRMIDVPETGPRARERTRRRHRLLRTLVRDIQYFGGREGRCQDAAMLTLDADPLDREIVDVVRQVLLTLNPRDRLVIELRYGLSDAEPWPHSLNETALAMKVTRERVRQIEAKAVHRLRTPPRCDALSSLLQ